MRHIRTRGLWFAMQFYAVPRFASYHPISHMFIGFRGALEGHDPESLLTAGWSMVIWILGFALNRLTLADFRDVGFLDV